MNIHHVWILICTILKFSRISSARAIRQCKEPILKETCTKTWDTHESFLMIDLERMPTYDVKAFVNIKTTKILRNSGDDQCMWQTESRHNSTCSHHYIINYDPNRRPTTIFEARCNCNETMRCLDGDQGSRCVPIIYYTHVLRKSGCDGKHFTYKQIVEPVTVGCTCAYPKVHPASKITGE